MEPSEILKDFGIDTDNCEIKPLGDGLINTTWIVKEISTGKDFVFQQINDNVFKIPENITSNIRLIDDYLKEKHHGYLFTSPIKALDGSDMIKSQEGGYFRLFGYIHESVTHNELEKPVQAYEAAKQFGKFTSLLSGINVSQLKTTIPDFHNLTLRYEQFTDSLKNATPERYENAREAIDFLEENKSIVDEYKQITQSKDFKLRVTHHDTKISNVLFDKDDKGLCVIDLDTIMPGYFISDVGDMMRTYLSPVSEEEKDFSKIEVRPDFFHAIVKGYMIEMKDELSEVEKRAIFYAGKFMIYMQAIRFIADYLNNDIYYGSRYEGQNLVRGLNQVTLLKRYLELEPQLLEVVAKESNGK
ncbi:MAG TPA: aminoglycoside phosphotransferase family protein [Prolixibacteraceae bacterium]|jgi:Ser/Thr protein kinase RdoA (MazF antagonist)|nr:aminoglycoside phosphotransferase family protein [Prolixibacteraceae bacterium]